MRLTFSIALLALMTGLTGCHSADSKISGDWVSIHLGPKSSHSLVSADPRLNSGYVNDMKKGTENIPFPLHLGSDHRFLLNSAWSGAWTIRGDVLTLRPDRDDSSLSLLNGYSESATHGIPDVVMRYSPSDSTLRWKIGTPKFNASYEVIFNKVQ